VRAWPHPGRDRCWLLDQWKRLATVADVITLLAAWLQPARDRATTIRWTLWRQIHRARAQISHYHRRGERPPPHLSGLDATQPRQLHDLLL